MRESKLKAYHVHDKENAGEEAHHEIVFAETASKAKYTSEAYSYGTPWTDIAATRSPRFDEYAGKDIPKSVYIADGWHFECDHCGTMTSVQEIKGKVYCDFCLDDNPELLGGTGA